MFSKWSVAQVETDANGILASCCFLNLTSSLTLFILYFLLGFSFHFFSVFIFALSLSLLTFSIVFVQPLTCVNTCGHDLTYLVFLDWICIWLFLWAKEHMCCSYKITTQKASSKGNGYFLWICFFIFCRFRMLVLLNKEKTHLNKRIIYFYLWQKVMTT